MATEENKLTNYQPIIGDEADIKKVAKKCCFVELKQDVSKFNLLTYYLVQFSYVCACTFIDACQDYLLESPDYFWISKAKVGRINSSLVVADNLYLILFIYIYGSFHDIFGRKFMIVYGFLSMSLCLFLLPMSGNIFPNMILIRLIFSNGICAVTTQPLLADYVNHKTKGFGGGIAAVVSGFGAIFAATFLLKLQSYMTIQEVYWTASALFGFVAIICLFGVKNIQRKADAEENVFRRL
jgi:MFS family permease